MVKYFMLMSQVGLWLVNLDLVSGDFFTKSIVYDIISGFEYL